MVTKALLTTTVWEQYLFSDMVPGNLKSSFQQPKGLSRYRQGMMHAVLCSAGGQLLGLTGPSEPLAAPAVHPFAPTATLSAFFGIELKWPDVKLTKTNTNQLAKTIEDSETLMYFYSCIQMPDGYNCYQVSKNETRSSVTVRLGAAGSTHLIECRILLKEGTAAVMIIADGSGSRYPPRRSFK